MKYRIVETSDGKFIPESCGRLFWTGFAELDDNSNLETVSFETYTQASNWIKTHIEESENAKKRIEVINIYDYKADHEV